MTTFLTFVAGMLLGAVAGALGRGWFYNRFFARARKDDRLMALAARVSARKSMAEHAEFLGYPDLAQRMRDLAEEDRLRILEATLEGPPETEGEDT